MSWSLSFNGYPHPTIIDTYHRIGISCQLRDLLDSSVQRRYRSLIEQGLCHIVIVHESSDTQEKKQTPPSSSSFSLSKLPEIREFLQSLKTPYSTINVIWTLVFHKIDSQTAEIISQLCPHNTMLPYTIDRFKTKQLFEEVVSSVDTESYGWDEYNVHRQDRRMPMIIGIKDIPKLGYDLDEIQYTLELINAEETENRFIKMIDFSDLELPSFKLRAMDFAHGRGLNCLIHIPSADINYIKPSADSVYGYECILQMAEKYGFDKFTVLLKIMLQMGWTPVLPITITDEESCLDFFSQCIVPLTHPFSLRRTFFSQTEIKRIMIKQEDVNLVASISEEVEQKADDYWKAYATNVAPDRVLQNRKALNVQTGTTNEDLKRFEAYVKSDLAKHVI